MLVFKLYEMDLQLKIVLVHQPKPISLSSDCIFNQLVVQAVHISLNYSLAPYLCFQIYHIVHPNLTSSGLPSVSHLSYFWIKWDHIFFINGGGGEGNSNSCESTFIFDGIHVNFSLFTNCFLGILLIGISTDIIQLLICSYHYNLQRLKNALNSMVITLMFYEVAAWGSIYEYFQH